MANLKRAGQPQPQTRSKRSKSQQTKIVEEGSSEKDIGTPHIEDFATQDEEQATTLNQVAGMFQDLASKSTQKDTWPREFSEKLQNDQAAVARNIHAAKNKILEDRMKFETDFLHILATALAPLDVNENVPPPTKPLSVLQITAAGQQLHEGSVRLFEESVSLVTEYKQLALRETQASMLPELEEAFAKDQRLVKAAITAGKVVTNADIHNLMADKRLEVRSPTGLTRDQEHEGRCLLANGENEEQLPGLVEGWGNVKYRAHKAVEKMTDVVVLGT